MSFEAMLEKVAGAYGEDVAQDAMEKVAAIRDSYNYGFHKLAEETAQALEEAAAAKEEEEEEELDEESEKAASELGSFIERGFYDGLCKLGSERYGNEDAYLIPYLEEKFAAAGVKAAPGMISKALNKVKSAIGDYHKNIKMDAQMTAHKLKRAVKGTEYNALKKKDVKLNRMAELKDAAKSLGLVGLRSTPHAAAAGGLGYGAYRALRKEEPSL
jgi:hypothetical protein